MMYNMSMLRHRSQMNGGGALNHLPSSYSVKVCKMFNECTFAASFRFLAFLPFLANCQG